MKVAFDLPRPQARGRDESVVTDDSPVAVLVVDDNAAKRLALKAVLSPLGHRVVEANSGRAALRCVMAQDFAVILLDVKMPGMDGFETAALIRQRVQSELTPIIFVTAHAADEVDRYAEGAVDFICAPVIPDELRAKVSVFVNLFVKADGLAAEARDVQAAAKQLSLVADAAPIGIFQTDAQNHYIYTNPRWSEITGIAPDEAAGRDWETIIGSEQRVGQVTESPELGLDRAELRRRFEIRVPGAASRIVLVTSRSIPDTKGEIAGWVGTLADVTAEAGAEAAMSDARDEANEASRLKSDFLANMSHEIRTPMNGVIGMTDLLLETELDIRQRDYAQVVRTSGEALLTIIDDILDFSKIEAGKLEIEDIEFDLRTVVDDVVALLAGPAQTKGLELVTAIHRAVPALVSGDPGRVRQVLTNLIGNAIKFTQTGEIVVRVTQPEITGTDTIIRFEVSDTGDGVAPDKLETVFQPFVQADTSTSRKYGGTGLGLAISSQLIALMRGDCGVSSRLGVGSTFWFTIRRGHADAAHAARARPSPETGLAAAVRPGSATMAMTSTNEEADIGSAPASGPKPEAGRLLLAEDNLINQKVAVAMLAGAGYHVDTVLNGAAAVQAVSVQTYDTILMDCQMPEMNGYEATAAIRAYEGSARHTPIIAMTAGARAQDRETCLAEGMDSYLAKPFAKDALLALVAQSLERGTPGADSSG